VNDREHPDEEMLSVTITHGVIPQKSLLTESSKKDGSNQDKSAYKLVCPRDLVYNKMRAWQGAIGISDYRGIVSPAYIVMRFRRQQNPRYFHYLYRTPHFAKEAERWSYGITSDMWSLRPEHFKVIYSPIPPLDEQDAIVRFLDWATGRLDRAIRIKRKLISLLNEQKLAIIQWAVTRGLDPNAQLKDSGCLWLGDIPEHWQIKPVAAFTDYISYGFTNPMPATDDGPYMLTAADISEGRIQYATARHTSEDAYRQLLTNKSRPIQGDLLITKDGTLGRVAIADGRRVCINQSVALLRLSAESICREFVAEALQGPGYQEMMLFNAGGSTIKHIYISRLVKMKLAVPPLDEQFEIEKEVRRTRLYFENVTRAATSQIRLLHDYRSRLITDVVTGKLDIRNFQIPVEESAEGGEPLESAEPDSEEDEVTEEYADAD
jgi:type I restriction enzyme S subunit